MADEGIIGMKKSDYRDPSEVVGGPVNENDFPGDIKFFLKHKKNPVGGIQKRVELYELIRVDGGLKLRLEHLETFTNRIPMNEEIALNYGPSPEGYKWLAKWLDRNNDEVGVESETIMVSEKWRDRYEAFQREKKAKSAAPVAVAVPAVSTGMSTAMEMIALINQGRREALEDMERMSRVLKDSGGPASVMERAYEAVGKFMEKTMESNMMIAKRVAENARESIERDGQVDDDEEEELPAAAEAAKPADGFGEMLKLFMPKIQEGLSHLLGGGPVGAAVKTLIVTSDQWKEIFADKEKFSQATEAMRLQFGEEKTNKALDILLSRRAEKKSGKVKK